MNIIKTLLLGAALAAAAFFLTPGEALACSALLPMLGAFNTTFGTQGLGADDDDIIVGTCMLGNTFGQILSADLERVADQREIKDCLDRLRMLLLTNAGFKYTFTAIFGSADEEPEMGDLITLPYIDITGIVMPGTKIAWQSGGERAITIVAQSWDHMVLSGGGANASVRTYNVSTGEWTGGGSGS